MPAGRRFRRFRRFRLIPGSLVRATRVRLGRQAAPVQRVFLLRKY